MKHRTRSLRTLLSHNSLSALGAFLPYKPRYMGDYMYIIGHNSLSALGAFLP